MTDRSEIGRSANSRGKSYERQLCGFLRENGFPEAQRAVDVGFATPHQFSGDPGDVKGTPGLIWDCKSRTDDLSAFRVSEMLISLTIKAKRFDAKPILIERVHRKGPGEWKAHIWADHFAVWMAGPFHDMAMPSSLIVVTVRLSSLTLLLRNYGYSSQERPIS